MILTKKMEILAKILAAENIQISQANVATASFNVRTRHLVLPFWKPTIIDGSGAEKSFSEDVTVMLASHEVGHAKYTPIEGLHTMKDAQYKGIPFSLLNIVEDARIEKKIRLDYPGLFLVYKKAYKEVWDLKFKFTFGDVRKTNFLNRVNFYFKFFNSQNEYTFSDLIINKHEVKIVREMEKMETFDDAVEVCKKIRTYLDRLKEAQEKKEKNTIKINIKKSDLPDSVFEKNEFKTDEETEEDETPEKPNPEEYDPFENEEEDSSPSIQIQVENDDEEKEDPSEEQEKNQPDESMMDPRDYMDKDKNEKSKSPEEGAEEGCADYDLGGGDEDESDSDDDSEDGDFSDEEPEEPKDEESSIGPGSKSRSLSAEEDDEDEDEDDFGSALENESDESDMDNELKDFSEGLSDFQEITGSERKWIASKVEAKSFKITDFVGRKSRLSEDD